MNAFTFDHLDEVAFEEFCFDLLQRLGFVNLCWKKGTGLSSSPADRGRDIECELEIIDVDGTKHFEKWFVECKHYRKGVPPEKLQAATMWAMAKKPDVLLIICSNFLSNSTHDFIEEFTSSGQTLGFRVKVWQRPDLERLTTGKDTLRYKYNLGTELMSVSIMHPLHIFYTTRNHQNSEVYFFEILDNLDPKIRDECLYIAYNDMFRTDSEKEIYGYEDFKKVWHIVMRHANGVVMVHSTVSYVLSYLFEEGNITMIDHTMEINDEKVRILEELQDARYSLEEVNRVIKERQILHLGEIPDKFGIQSIIELYLKSNANIRKTTEENYSRYVWFCENVVQELLKEDLIFNYIKSFDR